MSARIETQAEPIPGYRLMERLGGGGFGEVWKAEAPGGLHKAIKFVYGDLGSANEDDQRAEQELKALNRVKTVRHPYILSLERVDIIDGQLIIVMELADRNLWDRFKECRVQGLPGIPREELLRYMEEAAEALDLMNNEYNLQHLDIKPQNIFLVHQHVKVADFGLVKDLEGIQASVTGGVTPVYAAPEIFDGKVSRFSDQYSLAIVYQELLTGQRPFVGATVRNLIMQHMQAPPNLAPLPGPDQAVIGRSLAKTPVKRFPTCREMVGSLRRVLPPADVVTPSKKIEGERPPTPAAAPAAKPDVGMPLEAVTNPDMPTQHLRHRSDTGAEPIRVAEILDQDAEQQQVAPPDKTGEGCLLPALVIGLGQAGMLALQRFQAELQDHFHTSDRIPHIRLLLVDTDPEVIREATRGRTGAALSPAEVLLTPLNRPSHYLKPRDGKVPIETWLNPRMLYRIPRSQVPSGVRALGRLAFCDNYRAVLRRLQSDFQAILDPGALQHAVDSTGLGLRSNRPRVYLLAGLSGGTGGGIFLDLAYTVRARLKQLGYTYPDVVGLFFLPPLEGNGPRSLMLGNTYAALTELSHFGTLGNGFEAHYLERDGSVCDNEPPFSRTIMFHLPDESDEAGTQTLISQAARVVFHELCSPVGRTVDMTRAGMSALPWTERGLGYNAVGLNQITWPRRELLRTVARRLCQRLVQSWMSKDGKAIRPTAVSWVEEQWQTRELGADHFILRLNELCEKNLAAQPEEMLERVLRPLTSRLTPSGEKPMGPNRGKWLRSNRPDPAPELPPEAFEVPLKCLEEMVGKPGDEASEAASQMVPQLREAADRLATEWGQKLTDLHFGLLENPGVRLAGAEEGIRHVVMAIEKVLQHYEPLLRDLKEKAVDGFERLRALAAGETARRMTAQELMELVRSYPKWRYQSLVLQQTVSAFVCLRGHLSDELREVNFCRVRLAELLHMLERDPRAPGEGTSAAPADGASEQMFPAGCPTLSAAAETFLNSLSSEVILELDKRVQSLLQEEFRGFVHICLTTAPTLVRRLDQTMRELAEKFAAEFLQRTNVAEMFQERYPNEEAAVERLSTAYNDAAPETAPGHPHSGGLCVLAVPGGAAGDQIRSWASVVNPGMEFVSGAEDTILVYREALNQPIVSLEHMGSAARDAYLQMVAAEHFTPHTRIDVPFRK